MSITKEYYVIAGYDLTGFKTDKFDDWLETNESEKYHCYQTKGNIQLFYDPMSGDHLYFGKILAAGDQYYFETTKIPVAYVIMEEAYVHQELCKLIELGIISEEAYNIGQKIIAFEECR